jgi:two-component system response regulator (stage 0 sporulation protein A)
MPTKPQPQQPATKTPNTPPTDQDIQISKLLLNMGFAPHLLGYHYTVYAVKLATQLIAKNSAGMIAAGMTLHLYPEVAKHFDSTAPKVERAIRHSIDRAFDPQNRYWKLVGTGGVSKNTYKPTVSALIASMAEAVRFGLVTDFLDG